MLDVTAQPFEVFMDSEVFRPLGMKHSTFEATLPASLSSSVATAHYAGGEPVPGGYRHGPESAVAGLWTTPSDIARYLIEVQKWRAGSRGGLLSPQMTKQMLSPQIAHAGLGVVISGEGQAARFGHDGFNPGFESSMTAYVHRGQGAVVMANSGFAYMLIKEGLNSIARVYEWPHYDFTNQWPPSASIKQQQITTMPHDTLLRAAGQYALDGNNIIRIFARGHRLYLHWLGFGDAEIFRAPDGRLFCPQLTFSDLGDPYLHLVPDARGRVGAIKAGYGERVLTRLD
jgi:CubicO group peptidase (beta-lactamase class C family)